MIVTAIVWLAVTVGLFYQRVFHAWHWGATLKFFTVEFPILTLILIVVFVFESYYFREKE